jgi:hypothetical protein
VKHVWKGQQMGGDPADAGSTEWVQWCDNCGVEADDDNEDGECVLVEDDESIIAPILPPYEG